MLRYHYYPDLAVCDYFHVPGLRAIGWLDPFHEFERGEVPEAFRLKLSQLLLKAWHPFPYSGGQVCGMCEGIYGQQNLFVPCDSCIFVAPDLIGHYIAEHNYRPPTVFQEAVAACPPMLSDDYFELLTRKGITDEALARVWRY